MATTPRRILVVGGGPAGATSAFWLAKAGFEVTVAERSSDKFVYGQGIDITGPAVDIVKKMGLYDTIKKMTTGEGGFAILDDNSNIIARLGAGEGLSLTQDIEIMRGDLTRLLADAADDSDNVTYRYGCTITEIHQTADGVTVRLSGNLDDKPEHFAAVVGADGLNSKTRRLLFDRNVIEDAYKGLEQWCAFFSIKALPEDVPWSRLQHAPGRRAILIRPVDARAENNKRSSCYMVYTNTIEPLEQKPDRSMDQQKATVAALFEGFPGPIGKRALEGIRDANDLYFSETAQIKLPRWSDGRCVLVGDAAYAPSPASGQGTALAILGAYLVAGELATNPEDPAAAFAKYKERLESYVTKAQTIPLGGALPRLANPETQTGIRILRFVFWLISWSGVYKYLDLKKENAFDLPEYKCFE